MLLKTRILIDMGKLADAAQHLHEALTYDANCFELYETLVLVHIDQNKPKDARIVADLCRRVFGDQSPRPLFLVASVLAKDPQTLKRAEDMLEVCED
jgi:hypothetical protein